ncbi:hypothetical protein Sjap_004032 [Stephania japonica]|uniref:DYW domain-containing protein n=1 Tax=Stephania japonica TaxID=461633 RepID=A0AAP0PIP2_9MAGN
MLGLSIQPDSYTFPSVINACAGACNAEMGRLVHGCVAEMGFGSNLFIGNSLIDMYARIGDLDEAKKVFDGMPERDIVSWNSLISGYSANEEWARALDVYHKSRAEGLTPDSFTVSSVLPACGSLGAVTEGETVHGLVHKIGAQCDRLVNNGLLSMYCKFEFLECAGKVFDEMSVRDSVSWNSMICGYSQLSMFEDAIELFREMEVQFKPDLLTITLVLRACGHMKDLELGTHVHEYMKRNNYACDTMASNILITMYAKCDNLLASEKVFDEIKCRDCISWNSMINAYIQKGMYGEGIELFKRMNNSQLKPDAVTYVLLLSICAHLLGIIRGKELHCNIIKIGLSSDVKIGNAIVTLYAKCGYVEDALKVFEGMKECRDLVTWNAIIAGSVQSGNCQLALEMISQMRTEAVIPDVATMLAVLPACFFLATKRQGKEMHSSILKLGFESDIPIGNALIEMYSKCGCLEYAVFVFKQMQSKDIVTWTSLVSTYGIYGQGKNALRTFDEMEATGTTPDHIAFVAVIYACSHSGLVEDGLSCFNRMKERYLIEPRLEHYACVVDLLSRSGRLAQAEDFILAMPMKPDASIWGALLSACRAVTGATEIADRAAKQILELNSSNAGYHVLASNVYASLGKWEQVRNIRKSMKSRGLRKDPGCSWIEIKNKVYMFGTNQKFIEQYEDVCLLLGKLTDLMVKEGYVADKKFVLHDVEDDEKIDMLCGHSERLAIAFGLLNTSPGTPLQIMKNLRVCGDCHTVTKYISKIVQRKFLVRDANRFHVFEDGACSCDDRW